MVETTKGTNMTDPEATTDAEATPEEVAANEAAFEAAADVLPHPGTTAGIVARINYVQQLIDYVGKTGQSSDGYNFRTIDGVVKALHKPLGRAGVVIFPDIVDFYERPWTGYQIWKPHVGPLQRYLESPEGIQGLMAHGDPERFYANPNRLVRLKIDYRFRCEPDTSGWGDLAPGSSIAEAFSGKRTEMIPRGEDRETETVITVFGEGIDNSDKAIGKAMSYAYKALMSQVFSIPTEQPEMDNEHGENAGARESGASQQTPLWSLAGWQSEAQMTSTRKALLDTVKAMPPITQEHVKKWMSAYEVEQGAWSRAKTMRDAQRKSVAAILSYNDAVALQDKIDDVASAAQGEAAGTDPLFPDEDAEKLEQERTADGQAPEAEATEPDPGADPMPDSQEEPHAVVLRYLTAAVTPQTVVKLATATGLNRGAAQRACDSLVNEGLITESKVGRNSVYVAALSEGEDTAADPGE